MNKLSIALIFATAIALQGCGQSEEVQAEPEIKEEKAPEDHKPEKPKTIPEGKNEPDEFKDLPIVSRPMYA